MKPVAGGLRIAGIELADDYGYPRFIWNCGKVAARVVALRKRKFFSLEEVNQAIAELLVRLNQRPFLRKREGSRANVSRATGPAGAEPAARRRATSSENGETARVNIDYHIEVERHYYSVPYALVHQQVDVHLTGDGGSHRPRGEGGQHRLALRPSSRSWSAAARPTRLHGQLKWTRELICTLRPAPSPPPGRRKRRRSYGKPGRRLVERP